MNDRAFSSTVKYLIDVVPGHGIDFLAELMDHLFIFIFRLFAYDWDVARDVPTSDDEISATGNEEVVFAI